MQSGRGIRPCLRSRGRRLEQLGRQRSPDIAALGTALRDLAEEGLLILPSSIDQAVHSVPKDLMQGLGAPIPRRALGNT